MASNVEEVTTPRSPEIVGYAWPVALVLERSFWGFIDGVTFLDLTID